MNTKKSSLWFGRASIEFTGGANLESFLNANIPTEADDLVKLKDAVIYIPVSTADQVKHGISLAAHLGHLTAYAMSCFLDVVAV